MPLRGLRALPLLALLLAGTPAAAGETGPAALAAALHGAWRSLDDPRAVRRFAPDGTTAELYDGEALAEGTWEIAADCGAAAPASGPKLVIRYAGDPVPFCYGILAADPDRLELVYFPRGNTLRYARLQD